MESYIEKMARDLNYTPRNCKIPLTYSALLLTPGSPDEPVDEKVQKRYQQVVGKLLYPACLTRVDVAFHVNYLGRFSAHPTQEHLDHAYHVVDYLYTYKNLVMVFQQAGKVTIDALSFTSADEPQRVNVPGVNLAGYSDAAFADSNDRKSTSGFLFRLAGGTASHKSTKQKLVATSTTQAEYVALSDAAKEGIWLQRLLKQLGYMGKDRYPILIYGDNQPSLDLIKAYGHHERTKHIDIRYHYVREKVESGEIVLQHVRTQDMAADGLTKPLGSIAHWRFVEMVGLKAPTINRTGYGTD
jgi:hypothetical protein